MDTEKKLFTPLTNQRAFDEISSRIKQLIIDGVLSPGDRLPSEKELAKQFNVGRATVREALRILELSGFVVIQKGCSGGPIVKHTVLTKISGLYLDAIQLGNISIEQLTTARLKIEKAMMESVIEEVKEQEIESLQDNILRAWEQAENGLSCNEINIEFHRLLAKASKNPMFEILIESIIAGYYDYHARIPSDIDTCINAIKDHEKILEVIKEKDTAKALKLLDSHFHELKIRFRSLEDQKKES